MNHIPPFDWILGLGAAGAIVSIIDMNEALKLLILFATLAGIIIKTWDQIKKSEYFLKDIKAIWKRIRKK
jgi:aerobic-type carbon monoxide dehydrogenase small subunit (CoxS/CutS family)